MRANRLITTIVIAFVLLGGIGFGVSKVIERQQVAQAQVQANGKAVTDVTTIIMRGSTFAPAHIQVKVGTTVTWINQDDYAHTVTFDGNGPNSGTMQSGASYTHTFRAPGDFIYRCAVHPAMIARVTVVP